MITPLPMLSAAMVSLLLSIGTARADDQARFPLSATYREECGSCHIPYPPQLLSAPGWNQIMASLEKHFGSDASLDPAKAKEIAAYLGANLAPSDRLARTGSLPRITETSWFKRKHREGHDGLTASLWKSPSVRSAANCGACHPAASEGNYGEDDIRIPRIK